MPRPGGIPEAKRHVLLRGRGGDVISRAAGSGVLDEGALTAKAELSQDIEQGKGRPPGHRQHRYLAQRPVTGAALTSRNDNPARQANADSGHLANPGLARRGCISPILDIARADSGGNPERGLPDDAGPSPWDRGG